jgi:hypothetical protein
MLQELIKYLKLQEEAFSNHQLSPLYACVGSFQGSCVRFFPDVLSGKNFNEEKVRENTGEAGTKLSSLWRPLPDRPQQRYGSDATDTGCQWGRRRHRVHAAAEQGGRLQDVQAGGWAKIGQVSAKDMVQRNVEINRFLDEAIAKKTVVEGWQ